MVDAFDMVFFALFTLDVWFKIILEGKIRGRIGKHTLFHSILWFICAAGVIYEAAVSDNFYDFVRSENVAAKIFRSLKYFRFLILLFQTPYLRDTKTFLKAIIRAVASTRHIIILWTFMVLILSIMGYCLHHDRTLVDSNGKLDLENGKPHQVSNDGLYNSLIFTLLTIYNEEWDWLMFQEYLGSGVSIVLWQIITLIIGLILVSKYFMAMLVKEL